MRDFAGRDPHPLKLPPPLKLWWTGWRDGEVRIMIMILIKIGKGGIDTPWDP
jgi:hypothetical protein